jgi:hypothetical protein
LFALSYHTQCWIAAHFDAAPDPFPGRQSCAAPVLPQFLSLNFYTDYRYCFEIRKFFLLRKGRLISWDFIYDAQFLLAFPRKSFFTFDEIGIPTKSWPNFVEIPMFRFPEILISILMSKLKYRFRFRFWHRNFDSDFDFDIGIPISIFYFRQNRNSDKILA